MPPNHVIVHIIPHNLQRYDTAGDYWEQYKGDEWHFRISKMNHWTDEMLCLIHELTEKILCYKKGLTDKEIDDFDTGPGAELSDPGMSPKAPYHKEHMAGMHVERYLCKKLGLSWKKHDSSYGRLKYHEKE